MAVSFSPLRSKGQLPDRECSVPVHVLPHRIETAIVARHLRLMALTREHAVKVVR